MPDIVKGILLLLGYVIEFNSLLHLDILIFIKQMYDCLLLYNALLYTLVFLDTFFTASQHSLCVFLTSILCFAPPNMHLHLQTCTFYALSCILDTLLLLNNSNCMFLTAISCSTARYIYQVFHAIPNVFKLWCVQKYIITSIIYLEPHRRHCVCVLEQDTLYHPYQLYHKLSRDVQGLH